MEKKEGSMLHNTRHCDTYMHMYVHVHVHVCTCSQIPGACTAGIVITNHGGFENHPHNISKHMKRAIPSCSQNLHSILQASH